MPIQTPICDFGQKAISFELKSTDNKILSLNDIKGENGTMPVAGPVPPPIIVVMPLASASSICWGQMK